MTGKELFCEELRQLGYLPENKDDNRVAFAHTIQEGRFKGEKVLIGIEVPPDFPVNCPPGPHISPRLVPLNPKATDNSKAVESPFGDEWMYLSRPFRAQQEGWNRTKRNVQCYLKHVKYILNNL